jgi:hypothetical protein
LFVVPLRLSKMTPAQYRHGRLALFLGRVWHALE